MNHARTRGIRSIVSTAVLVVGLLVASCDRLFPPAARTMAEHPERFNGQTITVTGTVKERIDLQRVNCYMIDDGSGLIGVVTKGPMPAMGAKVTARGQVDTSFKLGRRSIIAIIAPDPPPTPKPMPMPKDPKSRRPLG